MFTGHQRQPRAARRAPVLTVAAMGAADELVQSMLPYRVGAVSDWVVDICASLVCASLLWTFMPPPVASAAR
ncbi:VanZ family protein [Massilia sp. H-1]|nr:VanZ family protein [Massilia sp. H-1]